MHDAFITNRLDTMKPLFLSLALLAALPAHAQFQKPEDATRYRQGVLFAMGQHFGRIGAMVNGRVPFDAKLAAENADLVAAMSALPWHAFVPNSDKGNTKAKPEVWSDAARFKEASDKLGAETQRLAASAKAGNLDALKAAYGSTGAASKACHDNFRAQ